MLDNIIRFSLKNRLFIVAASVFLLVYGIWVAINLPVDVFPDLNRPTVTLMTEAGGLAPEEVETLVTFPIEVAVNGTPGIERVRSTSGAGLSVIYLEFAWGTDIYRNRQLVSEKLATIQEQLPEDVKPVMAPVSSIMGEIQLVGLTSEDPAITPMQLRTIADWTLRPRLLSIRGVSQVIPIGGEVKQYQILLSAEALRTRNISLEEVESHLKTLSLNTTGGFINLDRQEYLIRNIGRVEKIEDIEISVIATFLGNPVLVKDVAKVQFGPQIKRGDGSVNGSPAVILSVQKQPQTSTLDLSEQVNRTLAEIQTTLPKGVKIVPGLFKQADFIEHAIDNVKEAIRDGGILVAIILTLLLVNFRTTAITLTAIPLSFVVTALIFRWFGMSINTMTLGGLAVAIGEVVDDATVDVENVFRRLKENYDAGSPKSAIQVIYSASSEVRNSIVFATIVVVLVFLPLFALGGLEGRFFAPLGISYVVSMVASLIVSLTVTPALCAYVLPGMKRFKEEKDGRLVQLLKKWDEKVLRRALLHPKRVILLSMLILVGSILLVPFMGKEFLPKFNEGTAVYNVLLKPGVSLEESNHWGTIAEKTIMETPEVKSVSRRTGRAELDEHAEGVHYAEIDVDFKREGRGREIVMEEIRQNLVKKIPGASVAAGQPISHRLDHLLSGIRAQIAIKIFGQDLEKLRSYGAEVYRAIKDVKGLIDLQIEPQVLIPQLKIELSREDAIKYNMVVGELAKQLETALEGDVTAQVLEGQNIFNIFMRFDEYSRGDMDRIKNVHVRSLPDGSKVRLEDVADVYESEGPNVIQRENMQRRIVVQANTYGRDLNSIINEIKDRVADQVKFPPGYYVVYGGQFESQQQASQMMLILGSLSLIAVFLVLYSHFRSGFITLQIMLNVPMALIGSLIAIWISDRTLSIASMVAFITLCGIASRNGIMMLSHYLHLMQHEGEKFSMEMVIRGSLERLVPVLSTALASIVGLIPLLLSKGEPGKEILYPLGVVVTGGLLSSTFLDMWVTPTVFYLFGRPSAEKYIGLHSKKEEELFHTRRENDKDNL